LAARRKVLRFAKENHNSLLEYIGAIQSNDAVKDMHCTSRLLALLGCEHDLSTLLAVVKNTPSLFLNCLDTKM
jgi:hypothetical protein